MSVPGRKRKLTDEQLKRIREWKPLGELASDLGITRKMAGALRNGRYQYKQPSP